MQSSDHATGGNPGKADRTALKRRARRPAEAHERSDSRGVLCSSVMRPSSVSRLLATPRIFGGSGMATQPEQIQAASRYAALRPNTSLDAVAALTPET